KITMINDYIFGISASDGIILKPIFVSKPKSQVPDDHVTCTYINRIVPNCYTITRRRLTSHCQISMPYSKVRLKRNISRYAKDNNTRPFLLNSSTQAARTAIIEICHINQLTASASRSRFAVSFLRRKDE